MLAKGRAQEDKPRAIEALGLARASSSSLAHDASQGRKKTSPKLSRLGGSKTLHIERGLAGHSCNRVTHKA